MRQLKIESEVKVMNKNKWNADAEMSMMGYPIAVESIEHLTHLVGYVLKVLKPEFNRDRAYLNARTQKIVDNALYKYNSSKDKSIKWFVVNQLAYDGGVLMTFTRDKKDLTLKSGKMRPSGILAWVENIDAPDCSELGYVFFEKNKFGKTVRVG